MSRASHDRSHLGTPRATPALRDVVEMIELRAAVNDQSQCKARPDTLLPFITDSSPDPVFPPHSPSHLGNNDSKSTVVIIRPASLLRWPQFDDARVRGQLQSERVQQRPTVLSESQRGKRKVACCRSHTLFFPACACVARGMVLARSVAEQRMGTLCMSDHGRALTVSLTHEALLAQGLGLHARGTGWPMSARHASIPSQA